MKQTLAQKILIIYIIATLVFAPLVSAPIYAFIFSIYLVCCHIDLRIQQLTKRDITAINQSILELKQKQKDAKQ